MQAVGELKLLTLLKYNNGMHHALLTHPTFFCVGSQGECTDAGNWGGWHPP